MAFQPMFARSYCPISTTRVARLAVLTATALVAAAAQSSSSQAPDPFLSAGGKDSCAATFASPELTQQAENWVAGVFLGKNYLNGAKAGSTIGRASIFSEVRQYCSGEPQASLGAAAKAVYEKLLVEGR
jgi:hypothetical protein